MVGLCTQVWGHSQMAPALYFLPPPGRQLHPKTPWKCLLGTLALDLPSMMTICYTNFLQKVCKSLNHTLERATWKQKLWVSWWHTFALQNSHLKNHSQWGFAPFHQPLCLHWGVVWQSSCCAVSSWAPQELWPCWPCRMIVIKSIESKKENP